LDLDHAREGGSVMVAGAAKAAKCGFALHSRAQK
jgi:hypothetical protein